MALLGFTASLCDPGDPTSSVCVGGEHTCACTHANDISHICGLGASVGTRKMAKVMKGTPFGPSLAEP